MAKPKKIVILGTGGNSIDILDTIEEINQCLKRPRYKCVGFLDDNEEVSKTIRRIPILGKLSDAKPFYKHYFINGIGSPNNFLEKQRIIDQTDTQIDRFITIIHPSASVSRTATIGRGVVIFQNVSIASDVTIGNHVIILPNSVISHNSVIGDYTSIAGGSCISGCVTIGKSCYLGTNCSIIGGVKIQDNCLIGMGAVVLSDVKKGSVVVGNPADLIRRKCDEC